MAKKKTKEEDKPGWYKEKKHPIMAYLRDTKGMGADCMNSKLEDEGYVCLGTIDCGSVESADASMLEFIVNELRKVKKPVEDIKILPCYIAHMSRWYANEHQNGIEIGSHSEGGSGHIIYVKYKPDKRKK